jgi:hypothetical protein
MTGEELFRHTEHLKYEIEMLTALPERLQTSVAEDVVIKNALIESFLVHVRNLADFFAKQRRTTLYASDFFTDSKRWAELWNENDGQWNALKEKIEGIRERVHEQVAHLTKERVQAVGSKKYWELNSIIRLVVPWMLTFAENADKLSPEMKAFLLDVPRKTIKVASYGAVATAMPHFSSTWIKPL